MGRLITDGRVRRELGTAMNCALWQLPDRYPTTELDRP